MIDKQQSIDWITMKLFQVNSSGLTIDNTDVMFIRNYISQFADKLVNMDEVINSIQFNQFRMQHIIGCMINFLLNEFSILKVFNEKSELIKLV